MSCAAEPGDARVLRLDRRFRSLHLVAEMDFVDRSALMIPLCFPVTRPHALGAFIKGAQ